MFRKSLLILIAVFALAGHIAAADSQRAYIRFAHFAVDGPNVDIYVDDALILQDFSRWYESDLLNFDPGKSTIRMLPADAPKDSVPLASADVDLIAGHNIDFALIGQAHDSTLHGLVIDETAEMANCDMSKSVFRILVNNIDGAPPISFYENDQWIEQDIQYGSYSASCTPAFSWDTAKAVLSGDLNQVLFDIDHEKDGSGGFWEPYTVYFWGLMGKYPGEAGTDYDFAGGDAYTVAPDATSFLSAFSGLKLTGDGSRFFEFDTAVELMKAAGIEAMLSKNTDPYTLFIPTDQAFAALPAAALATLKADPDAARRLLLNHIIIGDMSSDQMVIDGAYTSLAGNQLTFAWTDAPDSDNLVINGEVRVANFPYRLANGDTVWFIDNLSLLLPEKG